MQLLSCSLARSSLAWGAWSEYCFGASCLLRSWSSEQLRTFSEDKSRRYAAARGGHGFASVC
ncbi:hypothetical protein KC19_2G032400 [Ceratodon purpureus]|uniref:Uncharacterized protein n=1 Tax=Ceratodon purpureus TaxID=3225 RepID=A0A8T0ISF9_CERPU|nr:hypothetical protein KC19_2G032400 [Ceratodon purpureus]